VPKRSSRQDLIQIPIAGPARAPARWRDIQLTVDDHDELLATAEESLDQLTDLVASLLE
jgi:hypothetical protein